MDVFAQTVDPAVQADPSGLPIVGFGDLLTFILRMFFFIAGIAALIYGLWGALAWITSGGSKEEVEAARNKIQAAIVGVFIVVLVLSIIVALEQFVFRRSLCFGLSCPANIPQLNITPLPTASRGSSRDSNSASNSNAASSNGNASADNSHNAGSGRSGDGGELPATGGGGR